MPTQLVLGQFRARQQSLLDYSLTQGAVSAIDPIRYPSHCRHAVFDKTKSNI